MKSTTLLIVDDHRVVREGLKYILNQSQRFDFKIDEAENAAEALARVGSFTYDIILMDIKLREESGIDLTRQILSKYPDTSILALSMHDEESVIRDMLEAGAKGYVLKNIGAEELEKAFLTIMGGDSYFSNEVSQKLMNPERVDRASYEFARGKMLITKRERQILQLISEEMTNEEISVKLGLSKRTIDSHRQKMLVKLGLKNTAGLIKFGMKNNLIDVLED
jgi:DNA-binding NarL/FixJ family response regulator